MEMRRIKLVLGGCVINVMNAYAPQAGLEDEVKRVLGEFGWGGKKYSKGS